MTDFNYTLWIFLIPFLVFILLGLAGHRLKARISGLLGTAALGVVTVLSYITAYFYYFRTAGINDVFRKITVFDSTWLHFTDTLEIKMGILLDPISVMMLVVITVVSFMVHLFSLGYMKGEEPFATYYAFLGLFTFSMLELVLSTNIFQIYMF